MKKHTALLRTALALCMALVTSAALAAYYPLKLVNNTGNTKSSIFPYVIFTAQDTTTAANYCVLKLAYNSAANAQVASLVVIGNNTDSRHYTYRLDSLQGYDTTTKSVTILIPNTISGRCMVSLNYKLILPVVPADSTQLVFQDPSVSNVSDLNYDVIYDKFEFTYNQQNVMYIDPTAVDFFSIPISLKSGSQSSGAAPGAVRSKLMKTITNELASSTDSTWDSLVIRNSGTLMRITAPYLAPAFNSNYLNQAGFNYINSLVNYYQSNVVRINCSELDVVGDELFDLYNVSPAQDPGAYIFTSSPIVNGLWVFTNNPLPTTGKPISDTINMDSASTHNFFGPGTTPFITPNKTVISILVKNITAAFTVGLLPAPDSTMLDSNYLGKTGSYYKKNKQLNAPAGTGPWYNLYTKALHKAIPEIYAFAYDDVLGQSGTLVSSDNTDTISVTLGDMGDITLPRHSNLMNVLADTLVYNSGFVHIGNMYVDTLRWKLPVGQPSNARYFFMGSGPDFTIPPSQFLSYQYGNFFKATDTVGWVSIPDSLMTGNCTNLMVPMAVFTCGGPTNPCPTDTSNWTLWTNAASSLILPKADSVVYPVTVDSLSAFTLSGNTYQATVKWSIPDHQPSNAQYFFLPGGAGITASPDSLVAWQVGSLYSSTDSVGTLTLPFSAVIDNKVSSITIQVFTCGGPGHPCPVSNNVSYWSCDEGSNVMTQNMAAAVLKKRKNKK